MAESSPAGHVLVVAATERELASAGHWRRLRCGVGPVEAAAATAAALAAVRPLAVLHVGIAGARRAAGLPPGTLVIGDAAIYCDLGVSEDWAPRRVAASPALLDVARAALPDAAVRTIGTSATIGGTSNCDVEAMEGFAVLRAAQLAGVPAIEIRAISNAIEDTDRGLWRFTEAFGVIDRATPRLVAAVTGAVTSQE